MAPMAAFRDSKKTVFTKFDVISRSRQQVAIQFVIRATWLMLEKCGLNCQTAAQGWAKIRLGNNAVRRLSDAANDGLRFIGETDAIKCA